MKSPTSKTINVSIIGLGYWGPNYLRIFNKLKKGKIRYCCDLDKTNLNKLKDLYSITKITTDYKEVAEDSITDAVVISTPLNMHYEIAKYCLERGKHVLIEKPFVPTFRQGKELMKIAEKNDLIIMVGHVYKYHPGIKRLKEIMKEKLGTIYYISAVRVGLGPIRKHASVLWDLTIHDISIATYLLDSLPIEIIATGESHIQKKIEDVIFLTLSFPNHILYNIHASWIAPEKIRKITVVGSEGMAVFDDVNKTEMLKVYERKVDKRLLDSTPEYSDHQSIVRFGDIYIPSIDQSEPLENQALHYLECILKNKRPLTDAHDGLNIVKLLEAAEKSLKIKRGVKCQ